MMAAVNVRFALVVASYRSKTSTGLLFCDVDMHYIIVACFFQAQKTELSRIALWNGKG
jgi:hypothetical protein